MADVSTGRSGVNSAANPSNKSQNNGFSLSGSLASFVDGMDVNTVLGGLKALSDVEISDPISPEDSPEEQSQKIIDMATPALPDGMLKPLLDEVDANAAKKNTPFVDKALAALLDAVAANQKTPEDQAIDAIAQIQKAAEAAYNAALADAQEQDSLDARDDRNAKQDADAAFAETNYGYDPGFGVGTATPYDTDPSVTENPATDYAPDNEANAAIAQDIAAGAATFGYTAPADNAFDSAAAAAAAQDAAGAGVAVGAVTFGRTSPVDDYSNAAIARPCWMSLEASTKKGWAWRPIERKPPSSTGGRRSLEMPRARPACRGCLARRLPGRRAASPRRTDAAGRPATARLDYLYRSVSNGRACAAVRKSEVARKKNRRRTGVRQVVVRLAL